MYVIHALAPSIRDPFKTIFLCCVRYFALFHVKARRGTFNAVTVTQREFSFTIFRQS